MKLKLTKWIAAPVLAAGLMFAADAPSAKAQFGYHFGGAKIHVGHGSHRSFYPSYRYSPGFRYGHGCRIHTGHRFPHHYRSRGHYDWHPTEIYRHGNHYHVQPGHWDYHRGHH